MIVAQGLPVSSCISLVSRLGEEVESLTYRITVVFRISGMQPWHTFETTFADDH